MVMRIIYVAHNNVTTKLYIGQTKNLEKRIWGHFSSARSGSDFHFHAAIRKHGESSFEFSVIESCEDHLADEREAFWINHFDTFQNGYNSTSGGEARKQLTEDVRMKISTSKMGHEVSDETRKKMSEAQKRRPPISDETRKKMSDSRRGKKKKPHTEEAKQKMSNAKKGHAPPNKGKKASAETVEKMSKSRKGQKHGPHSEETKAKMRKPKLCKLCGQTGHRAKVYPSNVDVVSLPVHDRLK